MKRSAIVCGAGLLVIAASLGYCQARRTQIGDAFAKVAVGDPEYDVIAKMGRPHQIIEGCGYFRKPPAVSCAREYVYFPPWTIAGEEWLIAIDDSGAVTYTTYHVSP